MSTDQNIDQLRAEAARLYALVDEFRKKEKGEAILVQPRKGLYLVSKTSYYEGGPCDEAFPVKIVNVDIRSTDDPKKIPVNNGTNGDWYSRGENHRFIDGKIARDLGFLNMWAVEDIDIEEFVGKYGRVVVDKSLDGFMTIEIYDDYRE